MRGPARVGPHTGPRWTGPEEPGAPSPSAGLTTNDVDCREATNNGNAILFYWWVPTDRPNLRWAPEREHTAQNGKCTLLDVR